MTLIHVLDPGDFPPGYHAPRVGQSRQIRIENGVLAESLSDQRYCDAAAESRGSCGA